MEAGGLEVHPNLLLQFLVLTEAGTIEVAARRLKVSPAVLRRSMRRLERQLGTRLLQDGRTVGLTVDGADLVGPARGVMTALGRFESRLRSLDGVLRVAHSSDADTLSVLLARYCELNPDVRIDEQLLPCEAQLKALGEREIDVAVCRVTSPPPDECQVELLRLDPLLAAVTATGGVSPISVDPARMQIDVGEDGAGWPARDELILSFERAAGCALQRVRVPGAAGPHLAALERTRAPAFLMMSSSHPPSARRRLVGLVPLQPYFPWSLVWHSKPTPAVAAFVEAARVVSRENRWLEVDRMPGIPWLPPDDLQSAQLPFEARPESTCEMKVSAPSRSSGIASLDDVQGRVASRESTSRAQSTSVRGVETGAPRRSAGRMRATSRERSFTL
jgi:DNA-binding transcriptional LysR family regulator